MASRVQVSGMHQMAWPGLGVVAGAWVWPWVPADVDEAFGVVLLGAAVWLWTRRFGAMMMGVGLGALALASQPSGPALKGWGSLEGRVVASTGRETVLSVERWTPWGASGRRVEGNVCLQLADASLPPGTHLAVFGRAAPVVPSSLPGAPSMWAHRVRQRVSTTLRAEVYVSDAPKARATPEGLNGLSTALVTGDRRGVPEELARLMRRTGTNHLLAISGFHVGLVASMGWWLGAQASHAFALYWRRGVGRGPRLLAGWVVALVFVGSVGWPISGVRALGLLTLGSIARASRRVLQPLSLLGAVAVLQVCVEPAVVGSLAFQLSYTAVWGLIRWTPMLDRWGASVGVPHWIRGPCAASVAATMGTLPPMLWWIQALPPWSPFANLVAMPLAGTVLVPLSFLAFALPPTLCSPAVWAANEVTNLLSWCLAWFDGPLAVLAVTLPGALWLGGVVFVVRGGWAPPWAVLLSTQLSVVPLNEARVVMLDVGQGDATWVREASGRTWLIDTGSWGRPLVSWLRRRGATHVDVLVLTHADRDHQGGAVAVLQALSVEEVWLPELQGFRAVWEAAMSRGVPIRVAPEGALSSTQMVRGATRNDRSMVLSIQLEGHVVVFPGDITRRVEAQLDLPRAVVARLPHHGSRTSSSRGFLQDVRAHAWLVGAGRGRGFGHPHDEVLERVSEVGGRVFASHRQGSVEFGLRSDRLRWRAWTASALPGISPPWQTQALWTTTTRAPTRQQAGPRLPPERSTLSGPAPTPAPSPG